MIAAINQRTMRSREAVEQYSWRDDLIAPEHAALDRIAGEVRGRPILDLGVGGGRTVSSLRELSRDYLGVDSSLPMVETARRLHPGVRFRHADARDLSFLRDGSMVLVVFSCNGLGMVGHAERVAILREVHRVLVPGGAFLFSTHNRRSAEHIAGFRLPALRPSTHPVRMLLRTARFARSTLRRVYNRLRFARLSERTPAYSIINDEFHDYGVMLYYTTLAAQREQLVHAGFRPDALAFDLAGRVTGDECLDSTLTLLARS